MPLIAGIDEAGRGPVIGPLVLALVVAPESTIRTWHKIGVRDSKSLARETRASLFNRITQEASFWSAVSYPAWMIDRVNITHLIQVVVQMWIQTYRPPHLIMDAMTVPEGINAWIERIRKRLPDWNGNIIMQPSADARYPIVSAASIVAKHLRDEAMRFLKETYAIPGWGYPSESAVIRFLEKWYKQSRRWPSWVRSRWQTCRRIQNRLESPLTSSSSPPFPGLS